MCRRRAADQVVRCRSDGADRDALVGSRCRLGLNGARAERIDSNELPEIEVVWVSVAVEAALSYGSQGGPK